MSLELAGELNEDFLAGDGVAKLLNDLLDFIVKFSLRSDCIESLN